MFCIAGVMLFFLFQSELFYFEFSFFVNFLFYYGVVVLGAVIDVHFQIMQLFIIIIILVIDQYLKVDIFSPRSGNNFDTQFFLTSFQHVGFEGWGILSLLHRLIDGEITTLNNHDLISLPRTPKSGIFIRHFYLKRNQFFQAGESYREGGNPIFYQNSAQHHRRFIC